MQMYEQSVATSTATSIPLHQIFVQKQLELMVAQAWLEDNDALKQAAITLSAAAGVACAHTQMVMFEPSSSKEYDSSRQRQQQVALSMGFGDVDASMANTASSLLIDGLANLSLDSIGAIDIGGGMDAPEALGGEDCCGIDIECGGLSDSCESCFQGIFTSIQYLVSQFVQIICAIFNGIAKCLSCLGGCMCE
ncbi:hypothetical protein CYMTET_39264 [Cymbomonas tetramitiformis]|uniref:Uncharacterized protein n=1 Tax=Cymbomonas tetramitiformis TaxID=36881 RepID=A0AAE0CBU6_9CHLO|nr:hypothetical protein CYMTET_39264 [Cymbomonas tetramitiformis]